MSEPRDSLIGLLDELWEAVPLSADRWSSVPIPVPHGMFGKGSRRPFRWYLEGVSTVKVSSIDDVVTWLMGCMSVSDERLFGTDDHWQHPGEFEQIRMGDCDDHALWAWRKLVELGLPASFLSGRWTAESDDLHAWVVVTLDGARHIVEATSKVRSDVIRPFDEAACDYIPFFSVDQLCRTRAYLGAMHGSLGASIDVPWWPGP